MYNDRLPCGNATAQAQRAACRRSIAARRQRLNHPTRKPHRVGDPGRHAPCGKADSCPFASAALPLVSCPAGGRKAPSHEARAPRPNAGRARGATGCVFRKNDRTPDHIELLREAAAGRSSRRALVKRGVRLGLNAPASAALLVAPRIERTRAVCRHNGIYNLSCSSECRPAYDNCVRAGDRNCTGRCINCMAACEQPICFEGAEARMACEEQRDERQGSSRNPLLATQFSLTDSPATVRCPPPPVPGRRGRRAGRRPRRASSGRSRR
jgi:hypothetical protein